MLKLFGGGKPDHPMASVKEARSILDALPANDSFKAIEELAHWHESVRGAPGFKPDYLAQLLQMIDESAQVHARKLSREYVSTRLSKFQEGRIWNAIHGYWKEAAAAFAACVDLYASGAKGADALKSSAPLLAVRALRAVAAQMKWLYIRYGPFDTSLWALASKVYLAAEGRKFAKTRVTVYPGIPGESTPEQEFLRAVMLSVSSPDGLLPLQVDLAERLIGHFSASFALAGAPHPEAAFWIDLLAKSPPQRIARAPQASAAVRYIVPTQANGELAQLILRVKFTKALPAEVSVGGTYEYEAVLEVLDHLALYWSAKPPERKAPRHKVKSRMAVTHGLNGVLATLDPAGAAGFDLSTMESWIVDNVSAGGFGAVIPQIKGDWLRIGCVVGMQPEGGNNWLIGVVRRFVKESAQQGMVGIQTIAKSAQVVPLRISGGAPGGQTGILLDPLAQSTKTEALMLLRPGELVAGSNVELEADGKALLLLPAGVAEKGDDYELWRFRQMIRDTGE